ncbi:MAG: hypothetical protein ABH828_00355 [archaeon]
MKDSFLLKIALGCSLVGIVALFFIMRFTELDEFSISELYLLEDGSEVKIVGVVEKVVNSNNVTIISVSQKEIISGVIFEKLEVSEGERVEITGALETYEGEKEVLVEKIAVLG